MKYLCTTDTYKDGRYYAAGKLYQFTEQPPNKHFQPAEAIRQDPDVDSEARPEPDTDKKPPKGK